MKMLSTLSVALFASLIQCLVSEPIEANENNCDLPEPWVREETASIILNFVEQEQIRISEPDEVSSVKAQLALWSLALDPVKFRETGQKLPLDDLLSRNDDYITGIIWLLANSPLHRPEFQGTEQSIDGLNDWADEFVRREPRKMFLYLMALSRITGMQTLSVEELEVIDSRIPDPSIAFHIAGKLMQENQYRSSHEKLVESFESGSIRALYALGELEFSHFPGCSSRARDYIAIATEFLASR
ncbi:hypothetical protein HFP89_06055 [Wenzhouxiangella sp. XN79A]|uniref:hypothetical protein n=1 Tax=Wenzhouxiangella sp. XN79A TaxID=2724193 RepID=UPI00144A7E6F|nr:hypothetical protein [Wenzhouxiangella sp. XN79A]NKI34724.1 hypothetical protein [Wenzhouxiangella sp. XN79A]